MRVEEGGVECSTSKTQDCTEIFSKPYINLVAKNHIYYEHLEFEGELKAGIFYFLKKVSEAYLNKVSFE